VEEAVSEFEKALLLNPDLAAAHLHLGVLQFEQRQFESAEQHLSRANRLVPGKVLTLNCLAWVYRDEGKLAEAIAALQTSLKIQANQPEILNLLGQFLQRAGNPVEAADAFRKQLALQPQDAEAQNNLGLSLLQSGDGDGAIAAFRSALQIRPADTGYQGNLGAAYLQKADFTAASRAALRQAPKNQTLHYNLGLALKLQDKLSEAVEELRAAEALDPAQPDAPYTLGVTLWQMGDLDGSVGELQNAVQAKPDYAEA